MWKRGTGSIRVGRSAVYAVVSLCAGWCASAALCGSLLASTAHCTSGSEERALRQALTIVHLLRAEFSHAVPSLTETPAPTCAPTTDSQILSTNINSSRRDWTWYGEAALRRRLDYEDGFGAHPSIVTTAKSITSPTTTTKPEFSTIQPQSDLSHVSIPSSNATSAAPKLSSGAIQSSTSTKTSTNLSSLSSSGKPMSLDSSISSQKPNLESTLTTPHSLLNTVHTKFPSKYKSQSVKEFVTSRTSTMTRPEAQIQTSKKLRGSTQKDDVIDTPAPELQQVAVELAKELKASGVTQPALVKWSVGASKRSTARATWREHLARSTRYAVPLPDNHAFCYTDPHNALCRTFI